MYELERTHEWTAETPDPVAAMRVLSISLHRNAKWYLQSDGYALSSKSTRIKKAKDLESSARRVPDPIKAVLLNYQTPFNLILSVLRRPFCDFSLVIKKDYDYRTKPEKPVEVVLHMQGPDTDAIAGIMDRVRTEIESELTRQNAAGWSATPPPEEFPSGSTSRVVTNAWFVGIVGGLVATILWIALVAGWDEVKTTVVPAPQVSTPTTATSSELSPSK
ncbi:hypothetical protein ACXPWS_09190 [Mycobacterium sp. BMJ-28]